MPCPDGAGHIASAALMRRPNPGLWTAVALLLPLGTATLVTLSSQATVLQHLVPITTLLALHTAILVRVVQNRRSGPAPTPPPQTFPPG